MSGRNLTSQPLAQMWKIKAGVRVPPVEFHVIKPAIKARG
jgi:hypothetical protein